MLLQGRRVEVAPERIAGQAVSPAESFGWALALSATIMAAVIGFTSMITALVIAAANRRRERKR